MFPVILCGGSGERLWPASRPWRPKPFLQLVGADSGFQAALGRARRIAGAASPLVLGGVAHDGLIAGQSEACGVATEVLLEPEPRNTAAAIAAAAEWIWRRAPDAVAVILPADHHVPDPAALAAAVAEALPAASEGAIVTLGLRPRGPSSEVGYILPGKGPGPTVGMAGFAEKPDQARAAELIGEGALWNSGVFIAGVATLRAAMSRYEPAVALAAAAAVDAAVAQDHRVHRLGDAFRDAPSIAFDRAVMERTDIGAVLPVDFAWSDLGGWEAVLAADPDAAIRPGATVSDGANVLARATPGVRLAVVGLSDVTVVAEPDAILVAAHGHSEEVRAVAAAARRAPRFSSLPAAGEAYGVWLRASALPLWATVGVDSVTGAFREALTWTGAPADTRRRARVQARQAFVFASAAADGAPGPWLGAAQAGMAYFLDRARLDDGLYASALTISGQLEDPAARLYEQSFVLLALAALRRADPEPDSWLLAADQLREGLQAFRHTAGGFREDGDAAFQANAQMHLLEACLAWEEAGGGTPWASLSDEIAGLAMTRLVRDGVIHEFFDAEWRPLTGGAGLIEPGHQFEWAWLLERWGRARRVRQAQDAARTLFAAGCRAVDRRRGVVVNAVWPDGAVRDAGARLWPQTERLKASVLLGDQAEALAAADSLAGYLDTAARGVWRERMRADGGFVEEPSPATSLYHLYLAIRELSQAPS